MTNWTRAPRNQVGRALHDVARRDVPDDFDLRDAVKYALAQQWAADHARQRRLRRAPGYWVRESLKLAAAAFVFILIGAILALTFGARETSTTGGPGESAPAVELSPTPDASDHGIVTLTPSTPSTSMATLAAPRTSAIVALDLATGTERWRSEVDEDGGAMLTPIIAGDNVYGFYKMLYALDAETGAERWRFEARGAGFSPAADETRVYVPAEQALVALDAGTGQQHWSIPGLTHPAVGDGLVYAIGSTSRVHALDAETGAERWSFDLIASSTPVVSAGSVYVGAWGIQGAPDRVYALDAATGTERWSVAMSDSPYIAAVADGNVYVSSSSDPGELIVLDADTGMEQWRIANSSGPPAPWWYAAGSGALYVFRFDDTTGEDSELVALDAATGQVRWSIAARQGAIAYSNGLLIVRQPPEDYDGSSIIVALDATTGDVRWQLMTPWTPTLAASNGNLYLGFGNP